MNPKPRTVEAKWQARTTDGPRPSGHNKAGRGPGGQAICRLKAALAASPGTRRSWEAATAALALSFALAGLLASAQTPIIGPVTGFHVAQLYEPPNETRIKTLLEGGVAIPLPEGRWLITNGVKLQMFSTNTLQLVVTTSRCLYATNTDKITTVRSPGSDPVLAKTADGKYSIEGIGFLFRQAQAEDSSFLISNAVHTLVRGSPVATNAAASRRSPPELEAEDIHVVSDQFSYSSQSGLAIYTNHVQVARTNLSLASGVLTLELPMNERQLRRILAERDVAVDYTNGAVIHATGQAALFQPDTDRIVMTGAPTWRVDQAQGGADELIIDRTNQLFQANGQARLRLPNQSLGSLGSLTASDPNASRSAASTNRWIDIRSESYEFHTNWAVFRDHVRVTDSLDDQARGSLACTLLTVIFSGSNQLQQLVAEKEVVIQQDTNQFTGGKAVYAPTNGLLEITGDPAWRSGRSLGKGDLIQVRTNEMLVSGHASVRLPADELERRFASVTNAPALRATTSHTNEFADIVCTEYFVRPEAAVFEGNVHALHPQMDWTCGRLSLLSLPTGAKIVLAEKAVAFDLSNLAGQKVHGIGDRAYYTNWVTVTVTNNLVTLLGSPATLTLTNGTTVRNPVITYDHTTGKVGVPGPSYIIEAPASPVDSNTFLLPKKKPIK
jgi:lipopolysaccharide export system protein LptA